MALTQPYKAYIAGAMTEHPAPEIVRENIKEEQVDGIEWIDPMDHEAGEPQEIIDIDIDLIRGCDAIFVYWNPEIGSWGAPSELYHATQIEEIPAVVWQCESIDRDRVIPWLDGMADTIEYEKSSAIQALEDILLR